MGAEGLSRGKDQSVEVYAIEGKSVESPSRQSIELPSWLIVLRCSDAVHQKRRNRRIEVVENSCSSKSRSESHHGWGEYTEEISHIGMVESRRPAASLCVSEEKLSDSTTCPT